MADSDDSESKLGWATAGVWISVVLLLLIIFGQIFGWWERLRISLSGFSLPTLPGAPTWFGRIGGFFGSILNMFKSFGGVIGSVLVAVILLIPDTAVLGGFVADLANGQARYSVTSAFGMLAALLNWAFLLYFKGPTASTRYSFGAEAAAAAQAAQAADLSGAAAAAAVATGMFANPNQTVGVGMAPVAAAGPAMPTVSSVLATGAVLPSAAAPMPTLQESRSASAALNTGLTPGSPRSVAPVTQPGGAGARGARTLISDMTSLAGGIRGGRRQTGGASYALNPSSILGIPLGSKAQPAGLAVIVAIAVIYCLDAIMGKRYGSALAFQVIFAIAIVCGYAFSYYTTEGFGSGILWLVPLIVGIVVGGIGYVVMRQTGPQFLPLDPENAGTPTGEYSKCAKAPDNGGAGEYVCDAYLNGQRIGTVSS